MRLKIFMFCSAILLLSFASAFSTTLIVNTAPNYNVTAILYEVGKSYPSIQSFYVNSDEYGRAIITYDISPDQYNLYLSLRDPATGNDNIRHVRFDVILNSGEDIEVNFYPDFYHIEDEFITPGSSTQITATSESTTTINETVNATTEITTPIENTTETNVSSETKKDLTANSILGDGLSINKSTIYYIVGIVVIIVAIFLVIRWRKMSPKEDKQIKVKKLSELREEQNDELTSQKEKVEQARKTLQAEEERLKKLKNPNQDKIEEAKRRLIEDEKELMRLRRENSQNH